MSAWQWIETAPKDGRPLLLMRKRLGGGYEARKIWGPIWLARWADGRWLGNRAGQYGRDEDFTHWMPLPEPPEAHQ